MVVRLKLLGLPDLAGSMGGDEPAVDFEGATVGDLLRWLQQTHGTPAKTQLIDAAGQLDPDIVLLRNDRETLPRDALDRRLSDGDRLTLFVVVAGG